MHARWPRVAAAVGAAALALLFTGCRAEGTVNMLSPDAVEFDLLFDTSPEDCSADNVAGGGVMGLTVVSVPAADGTMDCRVSGTADGTGIDEVFPYFIATEVGEYYLIGTRFDYGLDGMDVTVTFPGDVVSTSGGEISGNEVRFTTERMQPGPLKIIARSQPGAQWWPVLLAVGGLLAGGLVFGSGWLLGRRRTATPAEPLEESFDLTPDAEPVADPQWFAPTPETRFAAGMDDDEFRRPRPAVDHSVWAPPGQDPPGLP